MPYTWKVQSHRIQRLMYLRDLLRELVARDMKVRYKHSVLGIAWSLITPLMQLLVFQFLFRLVLQLNIQRYPAFAFSQYARLELVPDLVAPSRWCYHR